MTVSDVMKLPSMVGAEVVAGRGGLNYPVESVNVLEYGWPTELMNRFFRDNTFDGNELLISALASIANDVEAQCENIRRFHAAGCVGMVLYYVGIIVPRVDERLLELCDKILVLCSGRVNGILDGGSATKEEVGLRMTNLQTEEGGAHNG